MALATAGTIGLAILGSSTGTVTSGGTTLADTTFNGFTASFVNLKVTINGAGVAGADYHGTITAFVDSGHVTISPSTSTAVTGNAVWTTGTIQCAGNGTTTLGLLMPDAISVGDVLFATCTIDPARTLSTFTDSAGNTYNPLHAGISNADYFQRIYAAIATKSSAASTNTLTATASGAMAYGQITWAHFPVASAYAVVDPTTPWVGQSATSAAGACSTGSGTPSTPNYIAYAITGVDTHVTSATQTGWVVETPNDLFGDIWKYTIGTAAGAINATATQSGATSIYVMSMGIVDLFSSDVIRFGSVA